jgi:colicin import membrane protein
MFAYAYESPNEKAVSGALALVMHALFFAMLVFSVTWQKREPAAMVAELWSNLPSPKSEVPPPPPPKVEPEPPQPKVEVKPAPKVEPRPEPKAEIDLREKKEKERKAKEELAEKKKREEQEKQAKEVADAKRRAQEQSDALRKQAQEQADAQAREIEKYKQAIAARIRRFIVEPPNIQGNPAAELDIVILPGGEVLDVRTKKASGQSAWDNACERAIRRAQPLPLPTNPELMKVFRELSHLCRYKE